MEKAYKLLALQEGIPNRAAKELIDRGVVYAAGKKVSVAREELSPSTKFKVEKIAPIKVLFEDVSYCFISINLLSSLDDQ